MPDVDFNSYVPDTIKAVASGTKKGMIQVAVAVVGSAKSLAPVALKNGGLLRGSIMWKSPDGIGGNEQGNVLSTTVSNDEVIVGTTTEYAIYQEYGTRKMAAQPYLRPAIEEITNGNTAQNAMKKAMTDSVRVKLGIDTL